MNKKAKKILKLVAILAFIVIWTWLMIIYGSTTIINWIGVKNTYLLVFIIAMFGGFSSISSAGFFATFIAFATGGANPWLLGIAAGAGLTIGDSFFYYLGLQGRGILSEKFRKQINSLSNWFSKQKSWKVQVFVFIYAGFTPLPNDILSVSLAIAGYPYKKIITPLLLGNIIFMTLLAFFIPFASQQFA